jgi:hypothetical protein
LHYKNPNSILPLDPRGDLRKIRIESTDKEFDESVADMAKEEFNDIVRKTYRCAIAGGSINIMAYIEDKYKFDIKKISGLMNITYLCDETNIKSVNYLIEKYGIIWPDNEIYRTRRILLGDFWLVLYLI